MLRGDPTTPDPGPEATRELVLSDPLLVLRLTDETAPPRLRPEASAPEALLTDLHLLGVIARRAARRLQHGGGHPIGSPRLSMHR